MLRKRWLWALVLALPLAAAGVAYGMAVKGKEAKPAAGYICPLTGEELPCPECCPLNNPK